MKILYYWWMAFTREDVRAAFDKLHIEYDIVACDTDEHDVVDEKFTETIKKTILSKTYDAVFSINFNHKLAEVCHELNLPYIAWSYDSPINIGNIETLKYDTTHLFLFDREEANLLKDTFGASHVYHLPLAVNTDRLDRINCRPIDKGRFQAQIAFVGQLYTDNSEEALKYLPDYEKGYLNAVKDAQFKVYGVDLISKSISEEFMKNISTDEVKYALRSVLYTGDIDKVDVIPLSGLRTRMQNEITRRERILLLSLLSRHYKTYLYSRDTHEVLENVKQFPWVNYQQEMPKVFKCTDINLNISLRSILSGIPQRCLDIMGCKGFLLSNYQPELDEYFENEKDCAIYRSIEEAVEYCTYYLEHDIERKRVMASGYCKVKKYFTFEERIRTIFETVGI